MIEFTTQNVVTVLCPLVHRSTTVKGLHLLLFTRFSFNLALICSLTLHNRGLTVQVKSGITETVNLLMCHKSMRQRLRVRCTNHT